jgi:phenylalanyl-tRNA synthetase beta chain
MRVPVSWLRDYVSFDLPLADLGELMSMTGTKLEALHRRGVPRGIELYRVGRVLTRDKHPNADRLSLCTVDVGDGDPRQIVCGASNFAAGAKVAVALPGAVLPDETELRVAKLRGMESHGMMLSERELDLGHDHDGIMLLPDDWPVGDALIDHLAIADDVLEFEITSNRPDCQNVYGVAREVSAAVDSDLAPWPGAEPEATGSGTVDDHVTARIDAPDLCPRWAGRVFTGVRVGPSPPWLKARIAAAGMRPISNVVDITNYVMLAIGEPTHAFDLDKVAGREIIVRRARDGELVTTLDGQDRTLDGEVLVIADTERPSAIAGLMGAEWSEVTGETTTVLIECANFDGPSTQRSSIRLGLRTEGSSRWEKGVDPHLVPRALALASQLMVELTGAQLVPGTVDLHGELPQPPVVGLRKERLEALIGVEYTDAEVERSLTRLGYERRDGGWLVPTWRAADTTREVDLIEEVMRIAGIERVPAEMPGGHPDGGRLGDDELLRRAVVDILRGAGLTEAATLTLWDTGEPGRLRLAPGDRRGDLVELQNPMSAEWTAMRTLVFPGLLHSARNNLAMGQPSAAMFELGHVFLRSGDRLPDQPLHVAGVLAGAGAGFFEAKGVVEALLAAARVQEAEFTPAGEPFLHPGRSAAVLDGFVGELHPEVAAAHGLEGAVAVFELGIEGLRGPAREQVLYRDVTSFPPLRQDIAVVVGEDVPAGRVVEVVRGSGGSELAAAEVFDVYRGAPVPEGKKSVALHLVFQSSERTLTDAEADAARGQIVAALAAEVGGELRE